ncbi:MAG: MFS transporter [Verrucomicrobia bacterium]|nr:MFS transporter [Verrucomicrobiota bacterium]
MDKHRSLRLAAAALFVANGFGMSSWISHIPLLKERLELNDQMLGLALLCAGMGALSTMSISGWLMSRFGSRKIAILSGIFFPVSLIGPGIATSFWSLSVSLLLLGACNGLMDIAMNSQAASYEGLVGKPVMSSFHAFWSLSCWCGSLCGSLFLAAPAWTWAHLPLIALAGLSLTLFARPGLLRSELGTNSVSVLSFPRGILAVFGLLCLLVMMTEGAVADWAGVHLRMTYHVSEYMTVFGYNAFALFMTIGRFAGDPLARRLGRKMVIVGSAVISAICLGIAAFAPTSWISIGAFGLAGFGIANLVPLLFSLAAKHAGGQIEQATSSVFATGYLGFLIGPPLVGFISSRTTLPIALMSLAGGLFVVASTVLRLNGAREQESGARIQEPGQM